MLNKRNEEALTGSELFLLMRLLQHLENTGQLPVEERVSKDTWQTIYSKLNHSCLHAHRNESNSISSATPG